MKHKIECPVCKKGEIHFDMKLFMTGIGFSCSSSDCHTTIKLPETSQEPVRTVVAGLQEISSQNSK